MRMPAARLAIVVLLLSACSSTGTTSGSPTSDAAPTQSDAAPSPSSTDATSTLEGRFAVADGRELHLVCRGEGSPTVIFEAGDESGAEDWRLVEPSISEVTRTCAYDRGGIGRSDPVSGCRQLPDLVSDLEALLTAADVPGPYVLVAASGGGFIATGFAVERPEEIAGIVFAEVPKAYLDAPPDIVELTSCENPANIEHRDYLQVEADAWNARGEIGDIPVVIVSNDYGPGAEPPEASNVVDQQGWLVLSPRAEQVVIESGHDVTTNEPDVVIDAVLNVMEAARADG